MSNSTQCVKFFAVGSSKMMANDRVLLGALDHASAGERFPAVAGHKAWRAGMGAPFANDVDTRVKSAGDGDGGGAGEGGGSGAGTPDPEASTAFVPIAASLVTVITDL
jgi:hypothetical protein